MKNLLIKRIFIPSLVLAFGFCIVSLVIDQAHQQNVLSRFTPDGYIALDSKTDKHNLIPAISQLERNKKPALHVAVAPIFSPEISVRLYSGIINYLGKSLEMDAVIEQRRTYAEINELLRDGVCQIGIVCTFPFVRGEKDFGLELLAVPQIAGKTTYNAFVIVPQASQARTLLDLRGKRFASADVFSSTGWLFPASWLALHGENAKTFFSSLVTAGNHSGSIEAVVNGDADGASVHSIVFDQSASEDPTLVTRVRILLRSPDFGAPPVVINPALDSGLKARIAAVLYGMHENHEGREALIPARIDKFIKPETSLYQSVRDAARTFERIR